MINFLLSFLPSFSAWTFALAGLACATAPVIIHLLNRRRYRVVHWAAMPFLREALQRNRKMMQLRDILILILRTAAVLFFGAALARPFFASTAANFDATKPLHAILVIDNSLSMGYAQLEGTLLDKAKDRAKTFIEELPEGSKVTVIPLCGSEAAISTDPYTSKDKSLTAAIDSLEVVDRSASLQRAVNEAKKARDAAPELSKRIVFISDQQVSNWRDLQNADQFKDLGPMQVVDVSPAEWENTWIADLKVQDGIADVETPTTFVVELQHRGTANTSRKDVQVQFFVGGEMVAEKALSLAGQNTQREVTFEHTFNTLNPSEGQPEFVPVKAVISADSLMADNERHLVVPVVASLPVVFIDQLSDAEEDPNRNIFGDTKHVRSLLAPQLSREEMKRQLIKIKHIKIDDLTQSDLEDARLVVIAGVRNPDSESTVKMLHDYVKQGGQLVIGTGGEFNPQAWNELAWLDGAGILPAPLVGEPIGKLSSEVVSFLEPLFLSFESLRSHYYFQLGDTSEQDLRDIYSDAYYFKYVDTDLDPQTLEKMKAAEVKRLDEEYAAAAAADKLRAELAKRDAAGELDEAGRKKLAEADERVREFRPVWLKWNQFGSPEDLAAEPEQRQRQLEVLAAGTLPQVRARFTSENGPAYLIERRLGRGTVLFDSSGMNDWNTLYKTPTFFMYDRILRSMIRSTLPERNFMALERITLPLPNDDRDAEITLKRPGHEDEPEQIESGFIGKEQLGVTVNKPLIRGLYHITAIKPAISADTKAGADKRWDLLFTVNGEGNESDLTSLTREKFEEKAADSEVRWVGASETISLAGTQISGQNLWMLLVFFVLLFLLLEIVILAWPSVKATLDERAAA